MPIPRIRFTVKRLMVAVAVVGLVLAAWLYRLENRNVEHALTGLQIGSIQAGDATSRRMAVENLASVNADDLGRVVSRLLAALEDEDWKVRQAAARSLGSAIRGSVTARNGAVGEELDHGTRGLVQALDDQQAEVRREAVMALGVLHDTVPLPSAAPGVRPTSVTIGTTDGRAVAPLLRLLNDPDPEVRSAAARTFARIAPTTGEGPASIISVMKNDAEPAVRAAAAGSLARGWPDSDLTYPLLLQQLGTASSREEHSAIGWSFGILPAPPLAMIPALVNALDPDDFILRRTIPNALAKLGPLARPALPALAKAAQRELAEPQNSALDAADAIATIDPDSPEAQALLEPIAALLRDAPQNYVQQQATVVLSKYGPSGAAAVPSLRTTLRQGSPDRRQRVLYLLGRIGPAAQPALEDLSKLERDNPDAALRQAIQEAVRSIRAD
ncbi:HEAT repeat domain-containing protein [Paludisphaera rhizosphaerae]|uniref:HEAT repeat domain-containing protein n=1 Tax=Paludisphaera rhizosphaerae TaxID=2711216 RepID=UPI0013E9C852|nr:HEAT repeat domain-containing protein [Paludisphaera rhizosphaerae]